MLEAKEEVRVRAELTLDEIRAERERMRAEHAGELAAKDASIEELQQRLVETTGDSPATGGEEHVAEGTVRGSETAAGSALSAGVSEASQQEQVAVATAMRAWSLPRLQKFTGETRMDSKRSSRNLRGTLV